MMTSSGGMLSSARAVSPAPVELVTGDPVAPIEHPGLAQQATPFAVLAFGTLAMTLGVWVWMRQRRRFRSLPAERRAFERLARTAGLSPADRRELIARAEAAGVPPIAVLVFDADTVTGPVSSADAKGSASFQAVA